MARDDSGADLPRNSEDVALIGDAFNDENTFVSQVRLHFVKFHNRVVQDAASSDDFDPGDNFMNRPTHKVRVGSGTETVVQPAWRRGPDVACFPSRGAGLTRGRSGMA